MTPEEKAHLKLKLFRVDLMVYIKNNICLEKLRQMTTERINDTADKLAFTGIVNHDISGVSTGFLVEQAIELGAKIKVE